MIILVGPKTYENVQFLSDHALDQSLNDSSGTGLTTPRYSSFFQYLLWACTSWKEYKKNTNNRWFDGRCGKEYVIRSVVVSRSKKVKLYKTSGSGSLCIRWRCIVLVSWRHHLQEEIIDPIKHEEWILIILIRWWWSLVKIVNLENEENLLIDRESFRWFVAFLVRWIGLV